MKIKKILIGAAFIIMSVAKISAENPCGLSDSVYKNLIEKTIVSTGNNYRMKKVLSKIKSGEKVYIAAIGGSVTEGAGPAQFTDGYAYQFFRALKAKYAPGDGKNLYFNDAGLSGTGSLLGVVRYQHDVVEVLEHKPDLLIVEFAVNDNGDVICQRSFEGIIREALSANEECAVLILYCAASYGNTSSQKKPVADYYSLPQINMLEVVNDSMKNNVFTKEQYYSDYVHPTFDGHRIMCESLMTLVEKMDKAKADAKIEVPSKAWKEPSMYGMKQILGDDENVKITAGGFNQIDKNCQTIKKTNSSNFPKNWNHKMNAQPDETPFKMEITCKNLIFVYKVQSAGSFEKFGKADVFVDGKKVATYDGGKEGGWNNCEPNLIIDEAAAAKHTVEVKMAPGSEKYGFTIVTMGYSK